MSLLVILDIGASMETPTPNDQVSSSEYVGHEGMI